MLNSAEIASMRAQQALALPDTVVIQRATSVRDDAGGSTLSWATLATVAGRLSVENRISREAPAGEFRGLVEVALPLRRFRAR